MRENADQKKSEYGRFSRSVEKECNAKKTRTLKSYKSLLQIKKSCNMNQENNTFLFMDEK